MARAKKLIKCKGCGKEIEQKGTREYCIKCKNRMDKARTYEYMALKRNARKDAE